MHQGSERTVAYVAMDAVAGARRTPGPHKTGGVPPKPPATLLSLSPLLFWDFGSLCQGVAASFWPAVAAAAFRIFPDAAASPWPAVAAAANAGSAALRRQNVSAVSAQLMHRMVGADLDATAVLLCRHLYLPTSMLLPRKKRRVPSSSRGHHRSVQMHSVL